MESDDSKQSKNLRMSQGSINTVDTHKVKKILVLGNHQNNDPILKKGETLNSDKSLMLDSEKNGDDYLYLHSDSHDSMSS